MTRPADTSKLIDRHKLGEVGALDALLVHTGDRLRQLTSRMLRQYPNVRRWEQTDDVLQSAFIRLCRALANVTIESPRHYYRLATLQIRRELMDLADRHQGAEGFGGNHDTDRISDVVGQKAGASDEPCSLAGWSEFHQHVGQLPEEERETFDLIWYQGLDQESAAETLGVSVRTVKRRWQSARLALARTYGGASPE